VGINDQYAVYFGKTLPRGIFYFISRFQLYSGEFKYGGFSTSGGGFWDSTSNKSATLIIKAASINHPTNLTASSTNIKKINLNWIDNSNNEANFIIQRKLGDTLSTNSYSIIATLPANNQSYIDSVGLQDTTKYSYRVFASNADTISAFSNQVQATTLLPVEFISFTTQLDDNAVIIKWTTATEKNNMGFEVQKSEVLLKNSEILKSPWRTIAFVDGQGSTTELTNYQFKDDYKNISLKGAIRYRLKQIDFDGTANYSNEIEIEVDFSPKEFSLSQNYPNPFNPTTTISFGIPYTSHVKLVVYNSLGEAINVLIDDFKEKGYYEIKFHSTNLSSGIYFYSFTAETTDRTKIFRDLKKLILIK
jgi:hypothetical protein